MGPTLQHSPGTSCPGAGSWSWARSRPSPVLGGLSGSPAAAPSTAGARRVPPVLQLLNFGAVCSQPASALRSAPRAPCPLCWCCLHPTLLLLPWPEERCRPSWAADGTANHGDVPRAPLEMAPWLGPCRAWSPALQPRGRGCPPDPPSFRCRPLLQQPQAHSGAVPAPTPPVCTAAFASSPADASARVLFYFLLLSFCCSVVVFGHFAARVMRRLPGRIAATAPPAPRTSGVPRPLVPSPGPCPGHSPLWGSAPHPCASGRAAAAACLPPAAPLPPFAPCSPPTLAPSPAPCRCPRSAPWPRGTARSPSLPPCSCPAPGPQRCPLPPGAAARLREPAWPGNCPRHPWVPPPRAVASVSPPSPGMAASRAGACLQHGFRAEKLL